MKYPAGYKGPRPVITCWRCHEPKPRGDFPVGVSGKRISPVCMTCVEAQAHEHDAMRDARTATKRRPSGQVVRRCSKCGVWKDLYRGFYKSKKPLPGSRYKKPETCKVCKTKAKREWEKAHPQRVLTVHRKGAKRYRERHPDRVKAAQKRRWAAIKADPVKHAQVLEDGRINRRLRKARKGEETRGGVSPRISQKTGPRILPSAPLLALVDRLLDRERAINDVLGAPQANGLGAVNEVCRALGVAPRTGTRWRTGEAKTVRVGVAEKVLLNADVEWQEVYSYDDHAHIFEGVDVLAER